METTKTIKKMAISDFNQCRDYLTGFLESVPGTNGGN